MGQSAWVAQLDDGLARRAQRPQSGVADDRLAKEAFAKELYIEVGDNDGELSGCLGHATGAVDSRAHPAGCRSVRRC